MRGVPARRGRGAGPSRHVTLSGFASRPPGVLGQPIPVAPLELSLQVTPKSRLDVIDVRARAAEVHGPVLDEYSRCLYCSLHTTAGFLQQSMAARLNGGTQAINSYIDLFRALFPEGAGYRHDQLAERTDLSEEQRPVEPTNGDSHLAFITGGLDNCVSYSSTRPGPVHLIDLDGVHDGRVRTRVTTLVGYDAEEPVAEMRIEVPVSAHPIDAINLREERLGIYEQIAAFLARHEVEKGRLRLELAPGEQHASLTVNEFETLLMRHDLTEVLRNPLRFASQTARHALHHPGEVPLRALGYAKYDVPRALNTLVDVLGLEETRVERLMARVLALPASRFLRMKRAVSFLVSDVQRPGQPAVVEGTYQRPILVQWRRAPRGARSINVTLSRFR